MPAFSAIADSTALLTHVIPLDQGFSQQDNYAGIFHFRFCEPPLCDTTVTLWLYAGSGSDVGLRL